MKTTYTLAEAKASLTGKYFHWHDTITDFVETFRIRTVSPADRKGTFRLVGKNTGHTVTGASLAKLLRNGNCRHRSDAYLITAAR